MVIKKTIYGHQPVVQDIEMHVKNNVGNQSAAGVYLNK